MEEFFSLIRRMVKNFETGHRKNAEIGRSRRVLYRKLLVERYLPSNQILN